MLTKDTIIKFIERQASVRDQKEVLEWLESSADNRKEFARLKNLNVALDIMAAESRRDMARANSRRKVMLSLKVAAAIVLAAALFLSGRSFQHHKWEKMASGQFTEIVAPHGEALHFMLPDGSKVILNGGSTLKFSKMFNEQLRDVYLSGEGYFEVAKDKKQFNVLYPMEAPLFKLSVLGTTFNISSYEENESIVTTLYDGSVAIEDLNTKRNFQLDTNSRHVYKKSTRVSSIEPVAEGYRWTDKYVEANGEDISTLAKRLERIFNVKISVDSCLIGNCSYTGALYGASLQQILDNMTYVSDIKYSMSESGKFITIEKK